MAVDVGEPAVDAVVPYGELGVVDAQQVKNRGVHVVDQGGVLAVQRLVAPLVAFPMGDAAADTTAAKPVGEDKGIVVAAFASL